MADRQNSWAALAARSRRGVVGTQGDKLPSVAERGVIGAVQGLTDSPYATGAAGRADVVAASAPAKEFPDMGWGIDPVASPSPDSRERLVNGHAEAPAVSGNTLAGATDGSSDVAEPTPEPGEEEGVDLQADLPSGDEQEAAQIVPVPQEFRPNPLAALAARRDRVPDRVDRNYEDKASSPFAALASDTRRVAPIRDIQAIKVVNHLVCGIALGPGSSAPRAAKSKALKDQIIQVDASARKLVVALGHSDSGRTDWLTAQCAETLAASVAHYQLAAPGRSGEEIAYFIDEATSLAAEAVARDGSDLADIVGSYTHGRYRPVTNDDHEAAEDRLTVSLAGAMADLLDKVLSPSLKLGGSPFTFDMPAAHVVELLGARVLEVATKASIDIDSVDMRIAHLQGSIRRVAALIGHEYVHVATGLLKWIESEGASPQTIQERVKSAKDWLPKTGVGEIVEKARAGFLTVEKIAPTLLEQAREEGLLPPAAAREKSQRGG